MKTVLLPPRAWESNSYLLIHKDEALLFDAGAPADDVARCLEQENATLTGIFLTHGHFDHIISIDDLRKRFGVPVCIHEDDGDLLTDSHLNGYSFFFGGSGLTRAPAEMLFLSEDPIPFAGRIITPLHTPGHTPGSCCYCIDDMIFTGDTLFSSGYGRTDLPGGNENVILDSLGLLSELPEDLTVYPGHGGSTHLHNALRALGF